MTCRFGAGVACAMIWLDILVHAEAMLSAFIALNAALTNVSAQECPPSSTLFPTKYRTPRLVSRQLFD